MELLITEKNEVLATEAAHEVATAPLTTFEAFCEPCEAPLLMQTPLAAAPSAAAPSAAADRRVTRSMRGGIVREEMINVGRPTPGMLSLNRHATSVKKPKHEFVGQMLNGRGGASRGLMPMVSRAKRPS
jgi:hypothetical protein